MKTLLLILLLLPLFFCSAHAEQLQDQASEVMGSRSLEEGLTPEEKAVSGPFRAGDYDAAAALRRLWESFLQSLRHEIESALRFALRLLALVFLCGLSDAFCPQDKLRQIVEICGACAAAALLIGGVDSLASQTTEAIYRMSDYSKAALPVVFTAAAAGGAVSSAGLRYAAVSFALDVMMSLTQRAVIPLIYAYLSLSLTHMIFPHALLGAVCRFAKWMATTVMTGATLAFTVYLSTTGAITGAVDAAAIKTTRSVISGALPVVGGMVSDASAAVLAAANLIRSCAGVFGLVAVCAICVGPFALLSVRTLLFKAVAALSDSVENTRLSTLFSGVGSAVAMLMGLLGSSAIMLFLSFTAAMKVVTV